MEKVRGTPSVKALLIASAKENCSFVAGADIEMLNGVSSAAEGAEIAALGQQMMNELAAFPIPTVAVIHGDCLGGGLELALACPARIASDSPRTNWHCQKLCLVCYPVLVERAGYPD